MAINNNKRGFTKEIDDDKPPLHDFLEKMIEIGASDIHMSHMNKVSYRVDMLIQQIGPIISGDEIFEIMLVALTPEQQRVFIEKGSIDFAYQMGGYRFRGSLARKGGEPGCVIRKINSKIFTIDELGLPSILKEISEFNWGLVLVTGPTGSGKTTSLAAIIDYINENNQKHITTIEEPVEYRHKNKGCFVTQREVPSDTVSFSQGTIDALRADPDVMLVGEMRDLATISAAITGSDTGHLVFGTLHTNTAPSSINRIVDVFPAEEHNKVRSQLSSSLRAIVAQRLFPNPKGGKTALFEIMIVNEEMREAIRLGKNEVLYDIMRKNKDKGNILMEEQVADAKARGVIPENVRW